MAGEQPEHHLKMGCRTRRRKKEGVHVFTMEGGVTPRFLGGTGLHHVLVLNGIQASRPGVTSVSPGAGSNWKPQSSPYFLLCSSLFGSISPPLPFTLGLIVLPIYFPSTSAGLFSLGCRKHPSGHFSPLALLAGVLANVQRGGVRKTQEVVNAAINSSSLWEKDVTDK